MATDKLDLNDVLCYLFNSSGKMTLKTIKSILVEFFQPSDITVAKKLLHEQVKALECSTNLPYIADRRGGEGRVDKEIDDLIVIINFLDENKLTTKLPKYVTDNPVNIPSNKLCEGDLRFLTDRIGKLEATILDLQAIVHSIYSIHSQMAAIKPGANNSYGVSRDIHDLNERAGPASQSSLGCQPATAISASVHSFSQKNYAGHTSNVNNPSADQWSVRMAGIYQLGKLQRMSLHTMTAMVSN
jgi:hypothetical protein